MNPIVNPWIIYAIDVAHKVYMLAGIAILFGVTGTILGAVSIDEDDDVGKKLFKYSVTTLLIAIPVLILIPDKETLLTMLALQYVTPDNIQTVQGNIIDFVGQIAQAVKAAK